MGTLRKHYAITVSPEVSRMKASERDAFVQKNLDGEYETILDPHHPRQAILHLSVFKYGKGRLVIARSPARSEIIVSLERELDLTALPWSRP